MEPDPVSGAGVMLDYLHLEAMANGTISGAWREWPKVRAEAKAALAELRRLRNIEAELAELRAEVERLRKLNDDQRISDAKTYTQMIEKAEAALAAERRDRDSAIEEAADEQTRSIRAALMDELHDHALTLDSDTPWESWREAEWKLAAEREKSKAGYQLSTYAACIRWDRSKNTQEWLDGLREHIEKVQALFLWPERDQP